MESSLPCAICGVRFSSPPHPRTGVHFPSKEWARKNGLVIHEGKWLPLTPRELVKPIERKKPRIKPRGLFPQDMEASDEFKAPEPDYSENIEDYEA